MPKKLAYSPVAALAMARAAQRLAQKYDDPQLEQGAKKLEAVAQAEINKLKAQPGLPRLILPRSARSNP